MSCHEADVTRKQAFAAGERVAGAGWFAAQGYAAFFDGCKPLKIGVIWMSSYSNGDTKKP
jgi:hypothetical protein